MPKSVSGANSGRTPPRPAWQPVLSVASLPRHEPRPVTLIPDRARLEAMARELGLTALRKVALRGTLRPLDGGDWQLDAMLGATMVQPCVVTLAPVTTRIDEKVERIWRAEPAYLPPPEATGEDAEAEIEMPEDVREEPLGRVIDLGEVLSEALALAVPDWPRAPGAELGEAVFAGPGARPLRDEDTRPFAGLAELRDRLEAGAGDNEPDDGDST